MFDITLYCENELQQKVKKNHDQGQVEKELEISWESIMSVLGRWERPHPSRTCGMSDCGVGTDGMLSV